MTANASSSSVTSPTDVQALLRVELAAAHLLAPLPTAWLAGRDRDLLHPAYAQVLDGVPASRGSGPQVIAAAAGVPAAVDSAIRAGRPEVDGV